MFRVSFCSYVWDHPRSRGVYSLELLPSLSARGSSPLARGLLGARRPFRRRLGIIPARAGFTWFRRRVRWACADHPRSRGVYTRGEMRRHRREGSSPLARGLLPLWALALVLLGIIPARAGFTRHADRGGRHAWDHPRSRGVYASRVSAQRVSRGSSPLARGLPAGTGVQVRTWGIIPARAGFTP